MVCIFYDGEICLAQPRTIKGIWLFKPTPAHRKAFCETQSYTACPKYVTYVTRLKKVKEEQEKTSSVP
jgi:recombinational DNA repair ATPase RecF